MGCVLESCMGSNVKVGVIPFEESEKRDFKFSKENYVRIECGIYEPWAWHESVVNRAHELMTTTRSCTTASISVDVTGAL